MSLVTFAIFEAHVPCPVFPQPIFCKGEKGTLLTFLRLNNNRVFGRNRICIQEANLSGRWVATCAYCEHYIYMVNDTKKKLDLQVLINSNRFQLNRFLCHNHSLTGWNRWKICCRRGSLQILGTFSFHRCHLCCSELCSWLGRPSSRNLARPLLWVDRIAGISCCQIN